MSRSQAVPASFSDEVSQLPLQLSEPQLLGAARDRSLLWALDARLWTLDARDTTILKGIAIFAIVFHNFFHAVSPVHQNEFTFDPKRFLLFLHTVREPALSIQASFSFLGHFGVQIFIFLSAFGLAKSHWDAPENWAAFMAGRVKKLYPMFGLVVLPWIIMACIQHGPLTIIKSFGLQLALMFVGLSPFLPGHGLPPVGPWWFIAFIVQFYAIWPLLRRLTAKFGWPGLLVLSLLCIAVTSAADPLLAHWSINLLETPIGRMPNICFGIVAARYPIRIRIPLALAACAVWLLGNLYGALWPFTFTAALIGMLWIYGKLRGTLRGSGVVERIGRYSLPIFLVNGIIRNEFVTLASSATLQLVFACLSAIASFVVAIIIQDFLAPQRRRRRGLRLVSEPAD